MNRNVKQKGSAPFEARAHLKFITSPLAQASVKALFDDVEEVFGEFYQELLKALPGDRPLERASAVFQMNEAKLLARREALVAAVGIQLEEHKIEIQREIELAALQAHRSDPGN